MSFRRLVLFLILPIPATISFAGPFDGQVNENMVGHKLGEFAMTRTFRGHAGGKKERMARARR